MLRRVTLSAIFLGVLIMIAVVAQSQVQAQDSNRAGVVVRFSDERVESRCVAFDQDEINGYTLLQRSGLALDVKSGAQGGLVCAIDGVGCGVDNCLCQCQGAPCVYWSYWLLDDEGWTYSAAGSSIRRVSDGDVDGWSWGPGSVTAAIEPPTMTFDEICSAGVDIVDGPVAAEAGSGQWLPYVAVGLLLAIIATGALLASRRSSAS